MSGSQIKVEAKTFRLSLDTWAVIIALLTAALVRFGQVTIVQAVDRDHYERLRRGNRK